MAMKSYLSLYDQQNSPVAESEDETSNTKHSESSEWKESESETTSEELDTARTRGSWDLPSGTVAWCDKDNAYEGMLRYSDLVLTEEEESGLLTDRIIASCGSYLASNPGTKQYIIAKLCLENKNLNDIKILGFHKFLQYVDLSFNNIKDLTPLGNLPYLMYLDVSHNLLEDVLQFQPPLNLTYVDYSYNKVEIINNLSNFWSLTYLDLSHNQISKIQGLELLRYLRYLNLSYNNITRFENLNRTRITDLNLGHNMIDSFEMGEKVGMKTLMNLTSLYLNNNRISDLKFLQGVYHLKTLELRGNLISSLLSFRYMKSLRKLRQLDLLGNPVSEHKSYRHAVLTTLPDITILDQTEVHGSEKVAVFVRNTLFAPYEVAQRRDRMFLLDQLNDEILDLDVLPVDQGAYPVVILVGPSASGKKIIVSKIAEKYPDKIFIGKLHTTRDVLDIEKNLLIKVSREEFVEKIKNGKFYCVTENLGHFYGFGSEMLAKAVKSHKLCLTFMSLDGAQMMLDRGINAQLVLVLPSSEEVHRLRLKKNYGPVITLIGAAYLSKRELRATHASNIRRINEILQDMIEQIIYWGEEKHHINLSLLAQSKFSSLTKTFRGISSLYPVQQSTNVDGNNSNNYKLQETIKRDSSLRKTFECLENCSPTVCGLQEQFKNPIQEGNQEVTDVSITTTTEDSNYDYDLKEEDSGSSSTSYSTVNHPVKKIDAKFFEEEDDLTGEDDIFGDWTSPFIDWDELNVDSKAAEEAADNLCHVFIERVMACRAIYENIHLENPGLFIKVFFSDDEDEAAKNLAKFLREVWRSVPEKKSDHDLENDMAYQLLVPRRLQKLQQLIQEERCPGDDEHWSEMYAKLRSPRTIINQMQNYGYQ